MKNKKKLHNVDNRINLFNVTFRHFYYSAILNLIVITKKVFLLALNIHKDFFTVCFSMY